MKIIKVPVFLPLTFWQSEFRQLVLVTRRRQVIAKTLNGLVQIFTTRLFQAVSIPFA